MKTFRTTPIIREVEFGDLVPLRRATLLPNESVTNAIFAGDERPSTLHLAAYMPSEEKVIGCASFIEGRWGKEKVYQLLGMAVDPAFQRCGIGEKLLTYGERRIRSQRSIRILWCEARVSAINFYRRKKRAVVGERFNIVFPDSNIAIEHVRMVKRFD